ncbi:hypothetical protein KW797_01910 [Candidatus Parcubacteria bacterium]|nr:hypothetical protein [Candidatus Parcubacteria bacterium]
MSVSATPVVTDSTSVIASTTLARGSTARATLDLRGKWGGRLFLKIARGGTNALTNGIDVLVRQLWNNGAQPNPAPIFKPRSQTTAANSTTVNVDSASAQAAVNVASVTGFAADQFVCVGVGTAREEYGRVSKTATGIITLDAPLKNTHTAAQADTVRNFAECWVQEVPGWSLIEVVFDYGDDAAGDTAQIEALAQTFDSVIIQ